MALKFTDSTMRGKLQGKSSSMPKLHWPGGSFGTLRASWNNHRTGLDALSRRFFRCAGLRQKSTTNEINVTAQIVELIGERQGEANSADRMIDSINLRLSRREVSRVRIG